MLKKKLCKKCISKIFSGWTEWDEDWWKDGEVLCPSKYVEKKEINIRETTEKPPLKCPYYLENLL